MKIKLAATIFEALSSDIRLDIFRLLAKHATSGLVAGDISRALNIPASNLSFHLKALTGAELAIMKKEGRFLRYRANIPLLQEIRAFLTIECCLDAEEKIEKPRTIEGSTPVVQPKRRVW